VTLGLGKVAFFLASSLTMSIATSPQPSVWLLLLDLFDFESCGVFFKWVELLVEFDLDVVC